MGGVNGGSHKASGEAARRGPHHPRRLPYPSRLSRAAAALPSRHPNLFHDYASTSLEDLIGNPDYAEDLPPIRSTRSRPSSPRCEGVEIAGVICTNHYPGSALAAAVAKRLGLPDPSRASL